MPARGRLRKCGLDSLARMTQPTTGIWGVRNGLNLDNLDITTDEEIDQFLAEARKGRGPLDPGPLYNMTSNSLWLYTRPDFAKLHGRMSVGFGMHGLERVITAMSFTNLHAYINQAWEIGIENCTRGLQQQGVTARAVDRNDHARPAVRRHSWPGVLLTGFRHHPA